MTVDSYRVKKGAKKPLQPCNWLSCKDTTKTGARDAGVLFTQRRCAATEGTIINQWESVSTKRFQLVLRQFLEGQSADHHIVFLHMKILLFISVNAEGYL
jgi:hypothetical protein